MTLKDIVPWRWGGLRHWESNDRPYESFLREMDTLHEEMNRLFDSFWKDSGSRNFLTRPWQADDLTPRIDETEDDKAYHVKVELPGMDEEDVDITLSDSVLTIRAFDGTAYSQNLTLNLKVANPVNQPPDVLITAPMEFEAFTGELMVAGSATDDGTCLLYTSDAADDLVSV